MKDESHLRFTTTGTPAQGLTGATGLPVGVLKWKRAKVLASP